ncbi:MAG TPA: hypothetical protein PKA98_03660 [Acidimicrobiales bacterium]|nr:hypothetical protein [Acidimicrobiales bacterium]
MWSRSTRWFFLGVLLTLLAPVGCGDGDDAGEGDGQAGPTTTAPAEVVAREDVVACLDDAGLDPEDTGLFVIGSEGTDVEAVGVRLDSGIVQVWVFDDAASAEGQVRAWEDAVGVPGAQSPEVAHTRGNVAVAYEAEPSPEGQASVESCLPEG